jgi:hypothetical protein
MPFVTSRTNSASARGGLAERSRSPVRRSATARESPTAPGQTDVPAPGAEPALRLSYDHQALAPGGRDGKPQASPSFVETNWPSSAAEAAKTSQTGGMSDNGCVRLKAGYPKHVWSVDFLFDTTEDGRQL